tara:strand:- start:599 stop:1015 length:417 start_codon:yes stop_codon:yes gene_type:complete
MVVREGVVGMQVVVPRVTDVLVGRLWLVRVTMVGKEMVSMGMGGVEVVVVLVPLVLPRGGPTLLNLVMVGMVYSRLLLVQRRIMPVELVVALIPVVILRVVVSVEVGVVEVGLTLMGQRVEQIQEGEGGHQKRVAQES